jgi:glycosyltransferase involved in cell wall biosynthesis
MKIALSIMGDERWMAGEVIVRNLLQSVRELEDRDVRLALLAPEGSDDARNRTRYSAADEHLRYPAPRRFSGAWIGNTLSARLLRRDLLLDRFLRGRDVDVLFGSWYPTRYPSVATMAWIPDFQHVHMPDMFSDTERTTRDRNFAETARLSTRVVLLSNAVADDFRARIPVHADKARVLSPITRVPPGIYDTDPAEVVPRYHLPQRFFYLPNQFWKHKDHKLLFEAVKNLAERGVPVTVVCTGYPGDYRDAGHFPSLCESVSRWGIRDRIIYLGLVPHDDVLLLIRQSVCVVNPSRFEGWGISIDEARTVGKRVLLSDIPTHREQDPPKATFFEAGNREDLESKLAAVWEDAVVGPDQELERAARDSLPGRLRAYAESFVTIATEARQAHRA